MTSRNQETEDDGLTTAVPPNPGGERGSLSNNVDGDLREPVSGRDHLRGTSGAPMTMLIYGDFECRHCAVAHEMVEQLRSNYGEQLRFAFRHMPIPSAHRHAVPAALAAEAAGEQGKFWEMHDRLYEDREALENDKLIEHARALDLDIERFREAIDREVFGARIEADVDSAVRSGVNEIPAFFFNGDRHRGRNDLDQLRESIEAKLG